MLISNYKQNKKGKQLNEKIPKQIKLYDDNG